MSHCRFSWLFSPTRTTSTVCHCKKTDMREYCHGLALSMFYITLTFTSVFPLLNVRIIPSVLKSVNTKTQHKRSNSSFRPESGRIHNFRHNENPTSASRRKCLRQTVAPQHGAWIIEAVDTKEIIRVYNGVECNKYIDFTVNLVGKLQKAGHFVQKEGKRDQGKRWHPIARPVLTGVSLLNLTRVSV